MKELDFVLTNNIKLAKEGVEKFKKYTKQIGLMMFWFGIMMFVQLGIIIWVLLIR